MLATAPDISWVILSDVSPQLSSTNPFPSLSFPSSHKSVEAMKGFITVNGSLEKTELVGTMVE